MAVQYANSQLVTNGLILALDAGDRNSYPGSGTSWTDLSGNGNHGTLVNGPTYSSTNGGSIVFDGSNDYMSVSSLANTSFPQDKGTISIWYNIQSTGGLVSDDDKGIFDSFDGGRDHIFIRNYFNPSFVIQVGFNYIPLSGVSYAYVSNHNITVDAFHNIVVTYVTGSSSSVKVYLDGVLANSGTISNSSWRPTGQFVGFGSYQPQAMQGKGSIIHLYNRDISATEVLQNYNAQKSRFGLT